MSSKTVEDIAAGREPELTTQEWIYAGRTAGNPSKRELYHRWALPAEGTDEFSLRLWNGKTGAPKYATVGVVYEVKAAADGHVAMIGGAKFLRKARPDEVEEAKVREWQLHDRAAANEAERWKVEARLAKDNRDLGKMTLDELRNALLTDPFIRRGMIAEVLRYLGVR